MESLDDVLGYNLKIYQRRDWFCFSLDSVLLANLASIKTSTKKVLDLGTGNGIVALILSLRTSAEILGVDIQEDLIKLACKSVEYNKLSKQIKLKCCDIKELIKDESMLNSYDLILSNPPYFIDFDMSKKNDNMHKTIARHEVLIKLEDIIFVASRLLKDGGSFCIINRTDRLIEIFDLFKKNNIEPKRITFIYKNIKSFSNMVFIEGMKNAKYGLKVEPPVIIYNVDGSSSDFYNELCKKVLV